MSVFDFFRRLLSVVCPDEALSREYIARFSLSLERYICRGTAFFML